MKYSKIITELPHLKYIIQLGIDKRIFLIKKFHLYFNTIYSDKMGIFPLPKEGYFFRVIKINLLNSHIIEFIWSLKYKPIYEIY